MDEFNQRIKELSDKLLEVCSDNDFEVVKQSLLNVRDYILKIETSALIK